MRGFSVLRLDRGSTLSAASGNRNGDTEKRPPGKLLPKALPRVIDVCDGLDQICLRDRSRVQHFHHEEQPGSADSHWEHKLRGTL